MRYTVNVKTKIINAVNAGKVTLEDTLIAHNITEEEYRGWERSLERAGKAALRVTRCQFYREILR